VKLESAEAVNVVTASAPEFTAASVEVPDADSVVKEPVPGVTLPTEVLLSVLVVIATPLIVPPVTAAAVVIPVLMFVKLASSSAFVSGEPLPARVMMTAIIASN
jgi:hypothetical protein